MRFLLLFTFLILFPSDFIFGQSTTDEKPGEYNNFIVEEQNKLINKIIEYNATSINNDNYEESNQKRLEIVRQLEVSIEKMKALSPFKNDSKLRDEALAVFLLYKDAFNIEFNDINLLKKERDNSFEAMEKYFKAQDKAEEKLNQAGDKFILAQKNFAKKFELTLVENTKNPFLNIAKVNQYSRNVFLEYYRVSVIDKVFLDALNNQQISVMEGKRLEILQAAEISLKNIQAIQAYNNDLLYKNKAIELIQFHKNIAGKEYLDLVTILQKKDLSQNDIDKYNNTVIQVNDSFQKLITEFNKEKREMLARNLSMN